MHLPTRIFFFNDTATTEIYTLSLHDALPICPACRRRAPGTQSPPVLFRTAGGRRIRRVTGRAPGRSAAADRKSTRLNSSHSQISYAVFCLKKKTDRATSSEFPRDDHAGSVTR